MGIYSLISNQNCHTTSIHLTSVTNSILHRVSQVSLSLGQINVRKGLNLETKSLDILKCSTMKVLAWQGIKEFPVAEVENGKLFNENL